MAERELMYMQAINEAIDVMMERDPNVILMGEDIAGAPGKDDEFFDAWGGPFGVTKGLVKKHGPERVLDTPLSEMAFVGASVGAAATGLRPIAELMFVDFIGVAFDPLLNQAAKLRYMFGGKAKVPMVVRTNCGAGVGAASQHSQMLYSIFTHIPGLKVVVPATPADAKGLLISAIEDDDPVVFLENKTMYAKKGPVPEGYYSIPLGVGTICREGNDVTIVALSRMVDVALEAAGELATQGIEAEVVDPRTLSPLDEELILKSVEKTGRLVVVDESYPRCSVASDIAAIAAEKAFDYLDAPIKRVTAPHTPVPFSPPLEKFYIPDATQVVDAAKSLTN